MGFQPVFVHCLLFGAGFLVLANSSAVKTHWIPLINYKHDLSAMAKKINNNTYGYCEETGDPIGLKRLIARPIATLSIEAQEKHEKNEKIFADT